MNREVTRIVTAHRQKEGGGFIVRRPFPTAGLDHLDPLLMLDELGPIDYAPGEAIGAPDHPHRGFETVSYILDGESEHADSAGHAGTLKAGDVQWMTAGDGVVHREMPSKRIQEEGGRVHGFQVWVNLPRELKRISPRYQEVDGATIPEVSSPDGKAKAKIIAGATLGTEASVEVRTPITLIHWLLDAGANLTVDVPAGHRLGLYVFQGAMQVGGESLHEGQLGLLGDGETLPLASEDGGQALLLGGVPLDEPIAWGGPFVMNTREEVMQAFADYRAGRMGSIPPEIVRA